VTTEKSLRYKRSDDIKALIERGVVSGDQQGCRPIPACRAWTRCTPPSEDADKPAQPSKRNGPEITLIKKCHPNRDKEIMSNELEVHDSNPFLELAAETAGLGRILKFKHGDWLIGADQVSEGTEFIVHVAGLVRGRIKFHDKAVVDRRLCKVAIGFKPPRRDELGDLDKALWEKDPKGDPRDPWSEQWLLPMESAATGDLVTFITGSAGGKQAIGEICGIFGRTPGAGLPIVALRSSSYVHKEYRNRVDVPRFDIVGRTGEPPASILPPSPRPNPIETLTHAAKRPSEDANRSNRKLEPPPWLDEAPPSDEPDYARLPDDGIR
jgi:hypothetical protein